MTLPNKEGQSIPHVVLPVQENGTWSTVDTREFFAGKKVIVFSLPGAFTPTCSNAHVPRFNELAPVFKSLGVDEIVCVSVNDTFVMNAWKAEQHAEHICFLPDGNGDFTREMGMLVDKGKIGFGPRSWRYSMFVDDGTIKKMFIEPEKDGDPYEVSDAETMLRYLDDRAKPPADIVLFTKEGCSFCARAKAYLSDRGLEYIEVPASPRMLRAVSGLQKTPQIFIDGRHIGGAEDLEKVLA